MQKIILILITLVLCSCSIFQSNDEKINLHPELPRHVSCVQTDLELLEYNSGYSVLIDYNSYIDHLDCLSNILRYIDQLTKSVCFYRKDQEEEICSFDLEN